MIHYLKTIDWFFFGILVLCFIYNVGSIYLIYRSDTSKRKYMYFIIFLLSIIVGSFINYNLNNSLLSNEHLGDLHLLTLLYLAFLLIVYYGFYLHELVIFVINTYNLIKKHK